MSSTAGGKETRDIEKQLRLYKRRYENALREKIISEGVRNNYEAFYQSSLEQQKELNEQLQQMAWFDSLTLLPNRKNFEDFLEKTILQADRSKKPTALLLIDLDGFKDINDTYGHHVGDEFLKGISQELAEVVRQEDMLARLGGDEFVFVINELEDISFSADVAKRIIDVCQKTIFIEEKDLSVSASVGISVYPDNIDKDSKLSAIVQLQKFADLAMYQAKKMGKCQFCYFDKNLSEQANYDVNLRKKVRKGLVNKEFIPAFQPIFRRNGHRIAGLEALARWPQTDGSCMSPFHFLPTLHKLNLAPDLDYLILEQVFKCFSRNSEFLNSLEFVSVNFDAKTLSQKICYEKTLRLIDAYGFDSSKLVLELTEGTLLDEDSVAIKNIKGFAKNNVRIALDDFGTGYSGLSYLNRFPIHIVKVDKYFTQSVEENEFSQIVVKHMLGLAEDLGFEVIAEGIETIEQKDFYDSGACGLLQGYFISKPMMCGDEPEAIFGSSSLEKPANNSLWLDFVSKP